jgi:thiol-disulfide isomerase/thioredoxin
VTGTPTVVVYINGKEADRIVGSLSKDALIDRISLRLGKEAV